MGERKRATVWDPVRNKQVPATPEEGVRQAVLLYLFKKLKAPKSCTAVEFCLSHWQPGNRRKIDIAVWKPGIVGERPLIPWLLVECKAPGIPIDEKVEYQVRRYLQSLNCPLVFITNGTQNIFLKKVGDTFKRIPALPAYR